MSATLLSGDKPLTLAILAMGGQGGGVLSDWIVALAERGGWVAQSTSVPGVAQRTGATIYYVEMIAPRDGATPILSLSPAPGALDVVMAAEWMEGGRAMMRGFVAPDRTTLIASTHRALAVGETQMPGDGVADPAVVSAATGVAARRTIAFDMAALSAQAGSVISAALFGALAGAGVLPFARGLFEDTIRAGGVGVNASLRAFDAAFTRTQAQTTPDRPARTPAKLFASLPDSVGVPVLDALLHRIRAELPEAAHAMAYAGVRRLVDWQDPAWAGEYLDRLGALARHGHDGVMVEGARQLAVALSYDDLFRVADLKTRGARFRRVRDEMAVRDRELIYTTEFMHPRLEEVCSALPARLGAAIWSRALLRRPLERVVNRGRRVQTGTLRWFVPLYALAAARRWRRGTLRHRTEMAHVAAWLAQVERALPGDPALAIEVLRCRRLVKGYSDTHARGLSKFDRVTAAAARLAGRDDAADWVRRLRDAALADEGGVALEGALRTVRSFAN